MSKIVGHGAPTQETIGVLGQEYFDIDSKITYTCIRVFRDNATTRTGEMIDRCEWAASVSSTSEHITDVNTGKMYKLSVVNGKLTMAEVSE